VKPLPPEPKPSKTPWTDEGLDPKVRAEGLLGAASSRGEVKRLGAWLDDQGQGLRPALLALAAAKGVVLDDETAQGPGKRLLKAALGREDDARERTNPIRRDEGFVCVACRREVPPHGRTARDHCPYCLVGLHVDVVPGDRASDCGGRLEPVAVELNHAQAVILYRCARCRAERKNRALTDGEVPDDWAAVVAVSSRQ
jgi:DNA-directed RNA polymerase subunit RPC12/RpoP